MSKVDFNNENLQKCICRTCPVQAESECAKEKIVKCQEMLPKMLENKELPQRETFPGLYCSSGKSVCPDLDTSKMCQCNECPIWEEYDLLSGEPMGYFCRDGKTR